MLKDGEILNEISKEMKKKKKITLSKDEILAVIKRAILKKIMLTVFLIVSITVIVYQLFNMQG